MTIWNIIAAAAAVISIATVAGFGWQQGRVLALRNDLNGARAKIEEQRGEIDDLKADREEDRATIAAQANDIRVLQSVVTGEVQLQVIHDTLDIHHETAEVHWRHTEETLDQILETLRRTA